MEFVGYGDWELDRPADEADLRALSAHLRPDDEAVCVWIDEKRHRVLRMSLDVVADGYEEAIELLRAGDGLGGVSRAAARSSRRDRGDDRRRKSPANHQRVRPVGSGLSARRSRPSSEPMRRIRHLPHSSER